MTNNPKHHSHAGQTKPDGEINNRRNTRKLDKPALPLTKQDEKENKEYVASERRRMQRKDFCTIAEEQAYKIAKQEGIKIGREQAEKEWKKELDKFYNSDKSIICQFCNKTKIGKQQERERILKIIDNIIEYHVDGGGDFKDMTWEELKQKIQETNP